MPVFDPAAGTLTFNITIVSDPKYIKFPDGIARLTYAKAVTPSAYARVCHILLPSCPAHSAI